MNIETLRKQLPVAAALVLAMTLTRFHHIGSVLHLQDASMAVFFLGGLFLRRHAAFAGYLLLAVVIDYVAVSLRGLSFFEAYCVTPSYGFLLLAYAALWYAGRLYAPRLRLEAKSLAGALGVGLVAATVSFLISNGAFYWLGGRYAEPHFAEYISRVGQWGPLFVRVTMTYIVAGLAAYAGVMALRRGGRATIARA